MNKTNSSNKFIILTSLVIIVLLILTMYQIDRQLNKIHALERVVTEQTNIMAKLQKQLGKLSRSQVAFNTRATLSEANFPQAFYNAKKMTKQADFAEGDWKVSAFGNNLKTITPIVSKDSYASQVQSFVIENLISRNTDTLEWQGLLAKDWAVSDNGLVITFNLRQDVVFSDGIAMTAEDVAFSFDLVMNPKIDAAGLRSYYDKIASIKATEKYQVTVTFKEPYFEALSLAGGIEVLPKHIYQKYMVKPEELNQSKAVLIGTGPYMLPPAQKWSPDKSSIALIKNPHYWGPVSPPYDKVVWQIIQNDSARLTAFRNGEIDSYGARPLEYKKLKADKQLVEKSTHYSYMPISAGYSYIGWSQRESTTNLFTNKLVRQAMTYLIDREKIKKDIFLNHAEIAISPFSPRSKQHNPELKPRKYNLEKGLALLKQAGFIDRDNDGILESESDQPFSFEVIYGQSNEDTKRMVLLIKDLLAKAKIELKPKPTEWPVLVEKLKNKDFEAIILGWNSGLETDIFQMFHSSQAKTNGDNFINYKSKELDALIDSARQTVDEKVRMPIWQKAENIMYEDQPYTFLFRRKSLSFIDKRFKNVGVTKFGLNSSFLPIETYVPKAAQLHQ